MHTGILILQLQYGNVNGETVRTLFATRAGASNVVGRTSAVCAVVVNSALGGFDARVVSGARVDTFGVYARLVRRTIRVGPAADHHAGDLRISRRAGRTLAHGLMVGAETFGRRAATAAVGRARGNANAVDARVLAGAIGFASTSGWKCQDVLDNTAVPTTFGEGGGRVASHPVKLGLRYAYSRTLVGRVRAGRPLTGVHVAKPCRP